MSHSSKKERNTFGLNLKTQKVVDFIETERAKGSISKTAFLNELLESLEACPIVLSSAKDGSLLGEVEAIKQLLNDDLMKRMPQLASMTRRDPVQMVLYLVERGIEADEKLKNAAPSDYRASSLSGSVGRRRTDSAVIRADRESDAA